MDHQIVGPYIKEDCVSVRISIVPIDAVESLRKLDETHSFANLRVHQETHGLSDGLAVVDVVVTIQVEHKWGIR